MAMDLQTQISLVRQNTEEKVLKSKVASFVDSEVQLEKKINKEMELLRLEKLECELSLERARVQSLTTEKIMLAQEVQHQKQIT